MVQIPRNDLRFDIEDLLKMADRPLEVLERSRALQVADVLG